MPIPKGTRTTYIVENMSNLVNNYNYSEKDYVKDYNRFMLEGNHLFELHNNTFEEMLNDRVFSEELRRILIKFGLDARASRLMPLQSIQNTISYCAPEFDQLRTANILLQNLNLSHEENGRSIYSIIRSIFDIFSEPNRITQSGGFVAASKTMHFIMPQLFIILDGQHIAISLYNISDYYPHQKDGGDWGEIIPQYSGLTPNPSPRGGGRENWDAERYIIALMYYKRIVLEWIQRNHSNIEGFLEIDSENLSKASRIIDKSMW